jgi:hypothetical protein
MDMDSCQADLLESIISAGHVTILRDFARAITTGLERHHEDLPHKRTENSTRKSTSDVYLLRQHKGFCIV